MKVLYVEDDPLDADLLWRRLHRSVPHITLETAPSLRDALDRLSAQNASSYDLVLTDLRLPDGDGLELVNYIRDRSLPLAVVVITGMGDESTVVAALKAGADDYIVKRDNYADRLPVTLENALRRYHAEAARRSRPIKVLYAERNSEDVDLTRHHFVRFAPHIQLDAVFTGPEALERFRQGVGQSKYDVVMLDYHLPGLNALELIKELREMRAVEVPVVLVTGQGREEVALQAIRLGAVSYVAKVPGYLYKLPGELENAHIRAKLFREQEARAESEERLARTESFSLMMATYVGLDGRWLKVPPTLCRFLGYSEQELLAGCFKDVTHPDDFEADWAQCQRLVRGESNSFDLEKRLLRKDGSIVWVYENCSVVLDKNGRPIQFLVYIRDISERKRAEEELRESEARFRNMADTAAVMIWVTDKAGSSTYLSRQWYELTGQTRETGLGFGWLEAVHPEDRAQVKNNFSNGEEKREAFRQDYRLRSQDGEYRWVIDSVRPRPSESGELLGYIGTIIDITERKRAEEALQAALEDVRQLKERLQAENVYLQEEISGLHRLDESFGSSKVIARVLQQAEQVARTDTTVLIWGETGTGKELLARAIHARSKRSNRPLIKVDCTALPASLIESELFGHEKGAFTGAAARRVGRFELADEASIFLDELGELPLELQVKLLRVLQEGEFSRLGSSQTIRVNVRVITATNRDLQRAVQERKFREDLYYRLNVYPINLPPLRERKQDIPELATRFLTEAGHRLGRSFDVIPQDVVDALQSYEWPGNVRELRNVIERSAIFSAGATLRLPQGWRPAPSPQAEAERARLASSAA
ncbi:MAG: sigma 54-interacting transcriptional regulator, partial [Candidatus Binatia bacterium]